MVIEKVINELICYTKADSIIANNMGDYLVKVVVEFMLSRSGLSLETPVEGIKHLNSIGSNLLLSYQNATVWVSGVEREYPWYRNVLHRRPFRRLDVRAVRGPLTSD